MVNQPKALTYKIKLLRYKDVFGADSMKNYIVLKKPKYRVNEVKIVDNKIIVKHSGKIGFYNINFIELFDEGIVSKNEMISELSDICGGYCNEYLKNKIKTIKSKYYKVEDDLIIYNFNNELENNFDKYIYIYSEEELSNIILNFGKSINTITKIDLNKIYNENQNINYIFKESYSLLIKKLKDKSKKLELLINKLVYKIGVQPVIDKDSKSSNWNTIIYISLLSYLYKESVYGNIKLDFNVLELLKYVLSKLSTNISSVDFEIIKLKKDSKEIKRIKSIIPFIIYYLENHYYYINYYNNWYSDHLLDELEDFREQLLLKTKNKEKREKISLYSYERLNDLLRRNKLNY